MANLFDKTIPEQAYHTKERPCPRECGTLIYFECRFDEDGNIITKDGKMPNGIFGKENNVKWFWRESISKSEHLIDGKCKTRSMSSEPPTEPQIKTLKKFKIYDIPATKQEASKLIGDAIDKINASKGSSPQTNQKTFDNTSSSEHGVKWEEVDEPTMEKYANLLRASQEIEALAVHEVSSLQPTLSKNSNTFGQIASATQDRFIQLLILNEKRAMNENLSRIYDKLGKQ